MPKPVIKKETIQFLKDLKKHNNRDWFTKHKEEYLEAHQNFLDFTQSLIDKVSKFDKSISGLQAKDCSYRIYRDTRFSKDKSPYKTYFGATLLAEGKNCGIAGYCLHLEPGNAFIAGGVHQPESSDMKTIREKISENGKAFLKIVQSKTFSANFKIEGEKLVKVPPGFDKEDPMGDYLRYKEMLVKHTINDKEITSAGFENYLLKVMKELVPFNNFVNAPLTK